MEDGKWDLKANHKVKIVMDDLYEEKDDDEDEFAEEPDTDDLTEEDDFNTIDDEDEYAEDDLSDLTILNEDELEDNE